VRLTCYLWATKTYCSGGDDGGIVTKQEYLGPKSTNINAVVQEDKHISLHFNTKIE